MAYVPLTKAPDFNTKWYISSTKKGGINKCVVINPDTGSTVPNCTGYVWGRFSELLGKACALPTTDAGTWYTKTTSYAKGKDARVGAVAVWSKYDGDGLVGIVEVVYDDYIRVSFSAYNGAAWYTKTYCKSQDYSDEGYKFQGFIYNPNVNERNPVQDFLDVAYKWKGVNPGAHNWVCKKVGYPSGAAWCCAFVWACAKEAGVVGKCIPGTASSTAMMKQGKEILGGQFIKGPYYMHGPVIPQPGDIFGRHNDNTKSKSHYAMRHVGIVVSINTNTKTFKTIEGNTTGGKCAGREYAFDSRDIGGFLRPDWSKVGGSAKAYVHTSQGVDGYQNVSASVPTNIYDSESTQEDATLRECCYLTDTGVATTATTDLKLSAINYTSGLTQLLQSTGGYDTNQSLMGVGSSQLQNGDGADASKFTNANARTIFNYFTSTGMNVAQAVGLLGNIQRECGFKPYDVNKSSGASGLCQWLGTRKSAMIKYCGSGWKNNLQGQMEFIWKEFKTSNKATWNALQKQVTANTLDMAKRAAIIICNLYERPFPRGWSEAQKNKERNIRANYAANLWSKLVITQGTSNNPVSQASTDSGVTGDELPKGTKIMLPDTSKQAGLTQTYMNYGYYSSKWKTTSSESQLAKIWRAKPTKKRRIATIQDCFLIAVSPSLGKVGDILTVVLANGAKFNAIICQNVSYSGSTWGNMVKGKIEVIMWAKAGDANQIKDDTTIDLTGWAGQAITYVINYGTYLK